MEVHAQGQDAMRILLIFVATITRNGYCTIKKIKTKSAKRQVGLLVVVERTPQFDQIYEAFEQQMAEKKKVNNAKSDAEDNDEHEDSDEQEEDKEQEAEEKNSKKIEEEGEKKDLQEDQDLQISKERESPQSEKKECAPESKGE